MLPPSIRSKMGAKLHKKSGHPLCRLANSIRGYFDCHTFDDLEPTVSIENNFDRLLIPKDHPSRQPTDTYYLSPTMCLRTHTSAHQHTLLKRGYKKFLVIGDVYRKDEIDRTHYPVFHQVEGVHVYQDASNIQIRLHNQMVGLLKYVMGDVLIRKVESYFPFTNPSWEYEVYWEGRWLEIAGCGIIEPQILEEAGCKGVGWAFGMGLERIAMALHKIPDIRLFWSEDERFTKQFSNPYDQKVIFKAYSNHPPCTKDISFWTDDKFPQSDLFQAIREIAGDLVEDVKCVDTFVKGEKTSLCYRVTYRSMDRTLTNEEINTIQDRIRNMVAENFNVEMR